MGKIVTIASGILCTDGMVLCTDTEHTVTDDRKVQGAKMRLWEMVYPIDEETDTRVAVGIAGAGHAPWIAAYIQGIDRDILADVPDEFDIDMFEEFLERYNQGFFKKYIRSYAENPNSRPQAYVLVLTQFSNGRRAIFHAHENIVLKAEDRSFVAVGAGAPVFEALAHALLGNVSVYKPIWTMKEAASISVYIMDKVKSEVPGCGGNSHVVMIGKDREQHHIPTRRIKELEIHHADVEAHIHQALTEKLVEELP
jgi:hypothetical protein